MAFPWCVLPPHPLRSARTKPRALGGSYADGVRERNGDSGGNLDGEGVNGQLTWSGLHGTDPFAVTHVGEKRHRLSLPGALLRCIFDSKCTAFVLSLQE